MRALNRVEVVVILLLIAVLLALAVPWMFSAREDARIQQCRDNLRRIGIALGEYADGNPGGAFPYGTWMTADLPPHKRLAWTVPAGEFVYLKQKKGGAENLFAQAFDGNKPWDAEANRAAAAGRGDERVSFQRFPLFHCPADATDSPAGELQYSSYVGMAGLGRNAPALKTITPAAGIWGYDRQTRRAAILDGLETTISVLETGRDNGPWTAGGPPTIRPLLPGDDPPVGIGRQFGGHHAEGGLVLYAGGGVRLFSNETDREAFSRLCTAAEGPAP